MGNAVVISGTATDEGQVGQIFSPVQTSANALDERDRELSRMIWDLVIKSKGWKGGTEFSDADDHWDFWRSKQWKRQRAASLSMAVMNEVYPTVETFLGHLSDNIPDPVARPRREEHSKEAQKVTKLLNWADDINDQKATIHGPVRSSLITGMGVWCIDWSLEADRGRGAPVYRFVDENTFFMSPWARDIGEAEWVIEASNVPLQYVKRNWERGWEVPPGTMDPSFTNLPSSGNKAIDGILDSQSWTTSNNVTTIASASGAQNNTKDLVTLIRVFIRQDDGTLRYIVCANGKILEDGASPYEDEEYPYVVFNVIPDKTSYTGRSMVGVIKKLQMMLNEEASYELDQQRFESDSPLVVKAPNIREGKTITNAPGTILPDVTDGGPGYYMLTKPGANARWGEMQERITTKIREITGNVDVLRGEHPSGVSTLGALEILRDEANVLVNKMVKEILRGLKRKNILVLNRIRQYMKDERTVRITGSGFKDEFVTINRRVKLGVDGGWIRKDVIPDDFEADLDFTPQPPGGSQAKFERNLALINTMAEDGKPLVDRQWVLESIEEDQERIDGLYERLNAQAQAEQEAAMQEQQALAAQEGGGASGVPPAPKVGRPPEEMDEQTLIQKAMEIFGGAAA